MVSGFCKLTAFAVLIGVLVGGFSAPAEAAPRAAHVKKVAVANKAAASKVVRPPAVKAKAAKRVAKRAKKPRVAREAGRQPARVPVRLRPAALVAESGLPRLDASAALVRDMATGKTLFAKNAEEARPIASLTKLMTAMVVIDAGQPMEEVLVVADDDVDRLKFSSSRLAVGTSLTREKLLHLTLMSSENRAAHALARHYPGGVSAFVRAMNVKARMLGLTETTFEDPTGLSPHNAASPQDLANLVAAAAGYPRIRRFSTGDDARVAVARRGAQQFRNTNPLVRQAAWDINLSKTGYTREAGRCLVMQVDINARPTLIVLLDADTSAERIRDAQAIKRWLEHGGAPRATARNDGRMEALDT